MGQAVLPFVKHVSMHQPHGRPQAGCFAGILVVGASHARRDSTRSRPFLPVVTSITSGDAQGGQLANTQFANIG